MAKNRTLQMRQTSPGNYSYQPQSMSPYRAPPPMRTTTIIVPAKRGGGASARLRRDALALTERYKSKLAGMARRAKEPAIRAANVGVAAATGAAMGAAQAKIDADGPGGPLDIRFPGTDVNLVEMGGAAAALAAVAGVGGKMAPTVQSVGAGAAGVVAYRRVYKITLAWLLAKQLEAETE